MVPEHNSMRRYFDTPPAPVSNEQFGPKLIRSERECSLDTPFGARDNIVKW
jgi:hypothetical protein